MDSPDHYSGNEKVRKTDHDTLRRLAEEVLEKKERTSQPPHSDADAQTMVHELLVHQVELEMQNEELWRARLNAERLQEMYLDLYEFAPVGYFTLEQNGTIDAVNLTGCTLLRVPREQVVYRWFPVFLDPGSIPVFKAFCRDVLEIGGKQVCEAELRRDRAQRVYVQLEGAQMAADRPELRKIRMTLSDITARKQVEETLKESEEKFRQLFENMGSGVAVYRAVEGGNDFVFQDFNTAAERIEMRKRSDLIGRRVTDVFPGVRESGLFAVFKRVWKTGSPEYLAESIYRDERDPGSWRENRVFRLPSGEIVAVYNDITERRQTEEALALSSRKLTLLSSITRHDILNQLMALKGYLGLSRDSLDDKKTLLDFLDKQERAARAIEKQIQFTKEYEQLGSREANWQNVHERIRKVISMAPHSRDIPVEVDSDGLEIFADPLFEKVFYNLIDNSLRYGSDRMTFIRVSSHGTENGLVIVFEDDGAGISVTDKKHLFTPGHGKNSGLGLFLSREILSITGITIAETGEPGKGARFEILVPKGAYRFTPAQGTRKRRK